MQKQQTPSAANTEGLSLNQSGRAIQQANCTPREWRAYQALSRGPVWREDLDRAAGSTNSPDVVMRLRGKGLNIWCERVKRLDRDGNTCRPGRYHLIALPEVTQ